VVIAPRCGIAVRGDDAVAVRVKRGRVIGVERASRASEESWTDFLARLGRRARGPGRWVPAVAVVVADRRCRSGPLFGVQADATHEAAASMFTASPLAFFVGGSGALVAGGVWRVPDGWAGVALDRFLADAIRSACNAARLRLLAVTPAPEGVVSLESGRTGEVSSTSRALVAPPCESGGADNSWPPASRQC
jgi:hypothetical protein